MTEVHTEGAFEELIESNLLTNGYRGVHHSKYDTERALFVDELIGFIDERQPKPWIKLKKLHGAKLNQDFLDWLGKDFV